MHTLFLQTQLGFFFYHNLIEWGGKKKKKLYIHISHANHVILFQKKMLIE